MTEEKPKGLNANRLLTLITGMFIGGFFSFVFRRLLLHVGRISADLVDANTALRKEARERARAERELERSESRFRSTFERAGIGMTVVDMQGNVLAANPAFAEFSGYDRDELIGMNVQQYAYPEDLAHGNELLFEMIDGKRDFYQVEKRYVTKDGSVVWGRLTASIARNPAPEPPFIIGMIEDVTERKMAEQREHEMEEEKLEFYRRTIIAATDGKLVITDPEEIEKLAGRPEARWEITDPSELPEARDEAFDIARSAGMDEERAWNFVTCMGEAVSNAIKHAGPGIASLHRTEDSLLLVVRDQGPGIPSLTLPDVALRVRYSTAGTLGMGYKIMIALGDRVYLATGPTGTTVAVEMAFKPAEPTIESFDLLSLSD